MSDNIWDSARQTVGQAVANVGSALKVIPAAASGYTPSANTGMAGINKGWTLADFIAGKDVTGAFDVKAAENTMKPVSTFNPVATSTGQVYGPPAPSNNGGGGGGGSTKSTAGLTNEDAIRMGYTGLDDMRDQINRAAGSQQDAAAAAAEAKRQAAQRKYAAQAQIAQGAKESAAGQYQWLIDTLGSNKKDLLEQVTINETQGLQNYADQETKTKASYDSAKQEILQTYRDLGREQERIMRGSGQGQSSRAQEATLRLNNLLGKDMSNVTTNEADSLALIGNALTAFKTSTAQTKNQIETETKSKLDKAALDYNDQIKSIDNNLMLSANEREDAYAEAEATLAADTAKINTWATGLKLQAEQTAASLKGQLDDYIVSMTDANGLLNSNLGEKTSATNALLKAAGMTELNTETSLDNVTQGVKQSSKKTYGSKEELDAAMAAGKVTPLEYSQQLAQIQVGTTTPAATLATAAVPSTVTRTKSGTAIPTAVQQDPLLSAMFA